jgi:hypothetical protein
MSEWSDFLFRVQGDISVLEERGCAAPFFRGHSDSEWKLLCGLGRQDPEEYKKMNIETVLYFEYMNSGGSLLESHDSSWDVLFSMQDHGLPTRLLTWTLSFSVALYFSLEKYFLLQNNPALPDSSNNPCVWLLNPYGLNRFTVGVASIFNPRTDLLGNYQENFIEHSKDIGAEIMAIISTKGSRRVAVQKEVFTLHSNIFKPLEEYQGTFLKKYELPKEAIPDAIRFLKHAGIDEFALFPDLEGLARHLKREYVDWF